MRWSFFAAAALMAAFALLTHGAPRAAVCLGVSGAALWNVFRRRA